MSKRVHNKKGAAPTKTHDTRNLMKERTSFTLSERAKRYPLTSGGITRKLVVQRKWKEKSLRNGRWMYE